MLIIDRFEGDDIEYAIVEKSESEVVLEMIEIKRDLLPEDARPGHVLKEDDGKYEQFETFFNKKVKNIEEIKTSQFSFPQCGEI
ncbi:DUF3006 domain-containing protein [Paenibacillus caui]|uniref:DUF3006 domain-containing protein n=1 Tax=Paenibacillus caui TaxID=2873927 RepID=UPI001CA8FC56|nr:DUF3006 domain-containing protein [Paenibacillus caui]